MFRVHEDIRFIANSKFPETINKIDDYYSQSNLFMSKKLLSIRSQLSSSKKTNDDDLKLILKNINGNSSEVITNAFFVIVAKSNKQPKQTVLNLFLAAFNNTSNILGRYKLIEKLQYHELLINEHVLNCLLNSNIDKEWEVYLGLIYANKLHSDFKDLWLQLDGFSKYKEISQSKNNSDWRLANLLLDSVINDLTIIPGDTIT